MGNSLAIVVGINESERLTKLKYAKQDALKIKGFLEEHREVQSVLLFTDDSEAIDGKPTRATHTNLRDLLVSKFEEQFLSPEDNLWFFFSGHGLRHNQYDYLIPIDGNQRDIDRTCITVDFVTKRLSRSGAGNIVLILDACRNASEGGKGGGEALGEEAGERIRERGLISIFACRPEEQSWEEDALGQGIFTFALLKALEEASCATVRQINSYLRREVPALAERYGKVSQTPWMVAEPIEKADLILSLKNVKEADLDGLKKTALEAEVEGKYDSALELWNRVNIASQGRDRQCFAAVRRIELKRHSDSERKRAEKEQLQIGRQRDRQRGWLGVTDKYSWVPFALALLCLFLPYDQRGQSAVQLITESPSQDEVLGFLLLTCPFCVLKISPFFRYPFRRILESLLSALITAFNLFLVVTVSNGLGVGVYLFSGFGVVGTVIKIWLFIRRRQLDTA